MTLTDPFADEDTTITEVDVAEDSPFDEPPAEAPKKAAVKKVAGKPASTREDGKVVLTLKGGSGFEAPWIVIHAMSLDDAYEQVSGDNASLLAKVMERTAAAAKHFGTFKPAPAGAATATVSRPQQQPPANAPDCPPGWEFKSGVSKAGKAYKGFFPPRGDESKPIFFN